MKLRRFDTPANWTDGQDTASLWAQKLDGRQQLDFAREENAIRRAAKEQTDAACIILKELEHNECVRVEGHAMQAAKQLKARYGTFLSEYVPARMLAIAAGDVFTAESLAEKLEDLKFKTTDSENGLLGFCNVQDTWNAAVQSNITALDEALDAFADKVSKMRAANLGATI